MSTIEEIKQMIKDLVEVQQQRDEAYEKRRRVAEEEIKEIRELQKRREEQEIEAQKRREEAEVQKRREEAEAQKRREEAEAQKRREEQEAQKRREELYESWRIRQEKSSEQLKRRINQVAGAWDHRWGRFIEALVKQATIPLLSLRGIQIDRVRQRVKDHYNAYPLWEIDILAENSRLMVAIETKHYLTKDDVDEAIERFQKFKRDYKEGAGKVLYGGVGYLDCEEKIEKYAEKKGLFVFQSVGNSAVIINEENFKPKAL